MMRRFHRADVLWRVETLLLAGGLACMAAIFCLRAERAWYQQRYLSDLEQVTATAVTPAPDQVAGRGEGPLGRLEIPRARISAVILDGVDTRTLRRAIGHIPGTAYPGEKGRVALAAHRDSFFQNLGVLRQGDTILLYSPGGSHEYTVQTILVVPPERTDVLNPSAADMLTLVTCYPLEFFGKAPQRYIIHAALKNRWSADDP